jgi:inner membrane protease subunit SOM1
MAPPTPIYPASSLSTEINTLPNGKPRKPPIANLRDCALKEMVQYKCNIEKSKVQGAQPIIICDPVVRMFRV